MLHVIRHYLPARKALLFFSETALLGGVVAAGMTTHLLHPSSDVIVRITQASLDPDQALTRCLISSVLLVFLSQVAIGFNELYDFRISSSLFDRASRFVASAGSALFLALGAVLVTRLSGLKGVLDFPGMTGSQLVQTLVFTMMFGFALLYAWRHVFHFALHHWNFNERVLIVGTGSQARLLAREMIERTDAGYEPIGLLPVPALERRERGGERELRAPAPALTLVGSAGEELESATASLVLAPVELESAPFPSTLGSAATAGNGHGNGNGKRSARQETLAELVRRLDIDRVVVALEDRRGQLPTEELLRCRLQGVTVQECDQVYEHITGKIPVQAMRPSYLIFNRGFTRPALGELAKRSTDIVLALIGIALTWPVMLLVAAAVRLSSPGNAVFAQERVGREGKPFTLYKFRSMRTDAESATGPVWAQANDPRITPLGRFMRRTRLDELPQLFNVLAGDMTLVGPRPERPMFVENLERQIPYYGLRHIVKPGLTGWAQINYPYGNTVEDAQQKLQYDLFYIKNQSLLFDLSIVITTVKIVVLRKGT